jgi:hypothetical protein
MSDSKTTAEAVIIEALGFHGAFDAPVVAKHILSELQASGYHVAKLTRAPAPDASQSREGGIIVWSKGTTI